MSATQYLTIRVIRMSGYGIVGRVKDA